jgi:hypothetical protein
MRTPSRVAVAIAVALVTTSIAAESLYPAAGGYPIAQVAGNAAMALAFATTAGGTFICTMAVMLWKPGHWATSVQCEGYVRPLVRAAVLRFLVALALIAPCWTLLGSTLIRSRVKILEMHGEPTLLYAKWVEQQSREHANYRVWLRNGSEYTLVVTRDCADRIRQELEAQGISVGVCENVCGNADAASIGGGASSSHSVP